MIRVKTTAVLMGLLILIFLVIFHITQQKISQPYETFAVRVVASTMNPNNAAAARQSSGTRQLPPETRTPRLDISGDPERTRTALGTEQRDLAWAPQAEQTIKAAFATSGWALPVTVDCRSSGCEITGELSGTNKSNLRSTLGRLTGSDINAKLSKIGLQPDEHPVYTVVSDAPLRLSFSRLVARVTGA